MKNKKQFLNRLKSKKDIIEIKSGLKSLTGGSVMENEQGFAGDLGNGQVGFNPL